MVDGEVWQGAAGESFGSRPMTSEMVLGIGSNTKTCTAITLLRLQERGLVDIDTPIGQWFPQQPNIDGAITVRQLLHHTSGLGDYSLQRYRDSTTANLARIWKPLELLSFIPEKQFDAGTAWSYCNTNYLLAGIIAQEVGGASLFQLYRRELFDPLGLDSIRLFPDEEIVGELAHRWMGGRDAYANPMNGEWSGAWAAGALIATATEMVQLYDALFNGRVLHEQSMSELLSFDGPNRYGLGISQKMIGGEEVIGHSGEIRGYSSLVFWIPSIRASVAVLTNSIPSNPLAIAAAVVRTLRDQSTSVDVENELFNGIRFPAVVHDLEGRLINRVHAASELSMLASGMFVISDSTRTALITVGIDGCISLGSR
jgi:D-alanyl-D-alanine carboxypeptidase